MVPGHHPTLQEESTAGAGYILPIRTHGMLDICCDMQSVDAYEADAEYERRLKDKMCGVCGKEKIEYPYGTRCRQCIDDHKLDDRNSTIAGLCETAGVTEFSDNPAEELRGLLSEFDIKESSTEIIREIRDGD